MRRLLLPVLLTLVMVVSTATPVVLGVLTPKMMDEFSVNRTVMGLAATAIFVCAALLSPTVGRLADWLGARLAVVMVFVAVALGLAAIGLAPAFWVVLLGCAATGLGQAMANPATNHLISVEAPAGGRGLLTGVKQAGVQVGNAVGGTVLPVTAVAIGWRFTTVGVGLFALSVLSMLPIIGSEHSRRLSRPPREALGPRTRVITVYGGLLGFPAGAIVAFVTLFAIEGLGMAESSAGVLLATIGVVGIVGRLSVGTISERLLGHRSTLIVMAVFSALGFIFLAFAAQVTEWLAFPGAVFIGLGLMPFNVILNLVAMEDNSNEQLGRASGVMMTGFFIGLAIGAPVLGRLVDVFGIYQPGWLVCAALSVAAAMVARRL
ncbi:MAG: MFS transporter [Acidimicrobiia bacterium]|nr:MFS transporter [Acidimicrobiia bacterium]